ncbi:MAG: glycoside hydrolase family 25, partial [Tetragenococcus koreensis]|nr:glycoside hydrolase family 25 [Tetragenococcus koreensis]
MIPKPIIIDISEWQDPQQINYDQLTAKIDGVIVRVQYGSNYIDKHYKTHIKEFQKRNVPVAVYAWVRGSSYADMKQEAQDFYQRAQQFDPTFWWLDVEEQSMKDMRGGCEKYRKKLKDLGAEKVGVYVANHLYAQFNLATEKFDG